MAASLHVSPNASDIQAFTKVSVGTKKSVHALILCNNSLNQNLYARTYLDILVHTEREMQVGMHTPRIMKNPRCLSACADNGPIIVQTQHIYVY